MDFDVVIFDCDGALVDSELLSCRGSSEAQVHTTIACDGPRG